MLLRMSCSKLSCEPAGSAAVWAECSELSCSERVPYSDVGYQTCDDDVGMQEDDDSQVQVGIDDIDYSPLKPPLPRGIGRPSYRKPQSRITGDRRTARVHALCLHKPYTKSSQSSGGIVLTKLHLEKLTLGHLHVLLWVYLDYSIVARKTLSSEKLRPSTHQPHGMPLPLVQEPPPLGDDVTKERSGVRNWHPLHRRYSSSALDGVVVVADRPTLLNKSVQKRAHGKRSSPGKAPSLIKSNSLPGLDQLHSSSHCGKQRKKRDRLPDDHADSDEEVSGSSQVVRQGEKSSPNLARKMPSKQHKFCKQSDLLEEVMEFHFTHKGGSHHCCKHGVTFIVPPDAVSQEVKATLTYGIALCVPFEFPPGSIPVSPMVCIDINVALLKPIEVRLPHYVRLKDHNAACSLTFATADELECVFRADKERGVFKCGHYYASQSIDHFCWKCILENSDKSKSNSYCVTKVTPSDCKHGSWKAHFVFTYNLPTCVSTVRQQYGSESEYESRCFLFKHNSVEARFLAHPEQGWSISRSSLHKCINEALIDFRTPSNASCEQLCHELKEKEARKEYPPRISLHVLEQCGVARRNLVADVVLSGTDPEVETQLSVQASPDTATSYRGIQSDYTEAANLSPASKDQPPSQSVCSLFLRKLLRYLQTPLAASSRWFEFGLELGLDVEDLECIESDCPQNCRKQTRLMLLKWLRDDINPTWTAIVNSLILVEQRNLARTICEEQGISMPQS